MINITSDTLEFLKELVAIFIKQLHSKSGTGIYTHKKTPAAVKAFKQIEAELLSRGLG